MSLPQLDAAQTAARLPMAALCRELAHAARQWAAGELHNPPRQALPLPEGGTLLSMPAAAGDIAIHKLVNVCPRNQPAGLATIHGVVAVYDAVCGQPLLLLDAPTVTARRTAAVSMLAMDCLLADSPRHVALIGTGRQAAGHLAALAELYPQLMVSVHSRSLARAQDFCREHEALPLRLLPQSGPVAATVDVVITLTTSRSVLYDEAASCKRLVIATGAYRPEMCEVGRNTISASQLFSDDPAGARHEAGDLLQAGVDWTAVKDLLAALDGRFDVSQPVFFKSVGSAAWDLAAARCALAVTA